MIFRFRLFTFAGLGLSWSFNTVWAGDSCHIHPLETDMKETESRAVEWYSSLEDARWRIKSRWRIGCVTAFRMEFSME